MLLKFYLFDIGIGADFSSFPVLAVERVFIMANADSVVHIVLFLHGSLSNHERVSSEVLNDGIRQSDELLLSPIVSG